MNRQNSNRISFLVVVIGLALACASHLRAESFGPPSCGTSTWWNTTTLTFVSRWQMGDRAGTADSARLRAHNRWSPGDTAWVVLYEDDNDSPSALLARSDSVLLTSATCADYIVQFDNEQLEADTWYWIGVFIKTDGGSGFSPCLHSDPANDTMFYSSGDSDPPDPFSGIRDVNTNGPCVTVFYTTGGEEPAGPVLRRRSALLLGMIAQRLQNQDIIPALYRDGGIP